MQGDARVIEFLNEQLTAELTAINQYFLHAKMQENWGLTKLARYTRAESLDEMRHADVLTDRILFLEGLPNYQRLLPLRIGETVKEMFECDLAVEATPGSDAAAASAAPASRSTTTTEAPRRDSSVAVASPIPRADPVTIATLPPSG